MMMSAVSVEADMILCRASCGTAEVDDIKLKECNDCGLVRYCSDNCQREHRPTREAACKERNAELRDVILFRQPESSYLGDCPICFLPLPIDAEKSILTPCCSKVICNGCDYAHHIRESLRHTCAFCRHPVTKTVEGFEMNLMKRVEANDPLALLQMGAKHHNEGDYERSFEYYTKAAELGDVGAHYNLFLLYQKGEGVEKDEKKVLYHLEEATIGGHPDARYNLAVYEGTKDKIDESVKHWIIAANLGHDESIKSLKKCYVHKVISKEEFAAALRAHQAAVDATKSPQREEAEKILHAAHQDE